LGRDLSRDPVVGKCEAASLQALGEQRKARAIPGQDLDVVAAAIHEQEPTARVGILVAEDLLGQREQPVERLALMLISA